MQHSSVKPVPLNNLLKRTENGKAGTSLGSASNTFRSIVMQTGALHDQKGTVYVEFGSTKVICAVDGPKEITKNTDVDPTEGQICVFLKNISMESTAVPGIYLTFSFSQHFKLISKVQISKQLSNYISALRKVIRNYEKSNILSE